jgi:hypothetical protein
VKGLIDMPYPEYHRTVAAQVAVRNGAAVTGVVLVVLEVGTPLFVIRSSRSASILTDATGREAELAAYEDLWFATGRQRVLTKPAASNPNTLAVGMLRW